MKYSKKYLESAIDNFMPGCLKWKIDFFTLARMVVVEYFCFPEKYQHISETEIDVIKQYLIELKTIGNIEYGCFDGNKTQKISEDIASSIQ